LHCTNKCNYNKQEFNHTFVKGNYFTYTKYNALGRGEERRHYELNTSNTSSNENDGQTQRALIFQGGGALGAYEAGVFRALYDKLYDRSKRENKQLFDIVAGTSAGAINATLLVNYVKQNGTWEGSPNILYRFWNDVSTPTWHLENPFIQSWQDAASFFREQANNMWKPFFREFDKNTDNIREKWPLRPGYYLWPDKYGNLATGESARRYWSWYQFAYLPWGTQNVLSPVIVQPDHTFYNPLNFLLKYDNTPITQTIGKHWQDKNGRINPIKTDERQPRLILVAVDVQDATTVAFDSYPKDKDKKMWMSTYGDDDKAEHKIYYNEGITMEHLLTTMSSHARHKFPELAVTTIEKTTDSKQAKGEENIRPFMDGFYLSNTPMSEVLQAHRDYWMDVKGLDDGVPPIEIFIGDLYPTTEKGTPEDPDSINNRVQNVLFHDKSKYDEKAAGMVSDCIHIIKALMRMANGKGISDTEIYDKLNNELKNKIISKNRKGETRKIENLVKGRTTIKRVQRFELGDGQQINKSNDINGKAFEFSSKTINNLMDQGYNDTYSKCKVD
jgi:NTE family protein